MVQSIPTLKSVKNEEILATVTKKLYKKQKPQSKISKPGHDRNPFVRLLAAIMNVGLIIPTIMIGILVMISDGYLAALKRMVEVYEGNRE